MGKFIDLTGQRFGKLVVIERAESIRRPNGCLVTRWKCKCDCGNVKICRAYSLKKGYSKDCGCVKYPNLIGQKFGRLSVIKRIKNNRNGQKVWLCQCDCGNIHFATTKHLKVGQTRSCGCLAKELLRNKVLKHNMYGTRLNRIWQRMKTRCNNSNNEHYKNYGARGIKVCDEWNDSENGFINFYNWAIQNGYKDDLTIDRIDVNGNYEPSNCRWITNFEQQSNKRNNHIVQYYGKKYTISQLSRFLNINKTTLGRRIKSGWKQEELSLPTNRDRYKRTRGGN